MPISQDNSAVGSPSKGVRDRLLGVAEELFAECGFDGTSIRDLAAAAGCNIASVNYYFGGKEKLYIEIWRRHLLLLRDTRIASIKKVMNDNGGEPRLEDLLRSFAYSFIGPLVDKHGGPRLIKLMAREMVDPNLPSNMFGDEVIKPTLAAMQQALSKTCPDLPESKVALVVFSLIGQLVQTIWMRTALVSIDDDELSVLEPAKIIDHIVAFTAAGIRAYEGGVGK